MRAILLLTTGLLVAAPDSFAQLDPTRTPTPLRRAPLPAFVPVEAPASPAAAENATPARQLAPEWQRFQGASRCVQQGDELVCDNGYRQGAR